MNVTRNKIKIIIALLLMNNFLTGTFVSLKKKIIVLESQGESRNSYIAYVVIDGKKYLVKQKKSIRKLISAVRDALAAWIASILNIAHQVDIVGPKEDIPGKPRKGLPATIHTIAPGNIVREQRETPYSKLRLKQFWAHAETIEQAGLTKTIINHITWHKQLPLIVALDLIVGNSDRHCGNLCYDPESDTFCAIDMDDTFNKDLCDIACTKLASMMRDPEIIFSTAEVAALLSLRNTINLLTKRFKPDYVIRKMYHFAKEAGLSSGSHLYNYSIKKKLKNYEASIQATWNSSKRLIAIIDSIIANNKKKVALLQLKLSKGQS